MFTRVAPEDYFFLKQKFPMLVGFADSILSHLFKSLCNELRAYESANGPIESAWTTDHESYNLLRSMLERRTTGHNSGEAGARDVSRGVSGIHQTLCDAPKQCPDPESNPDARGRKPRSGKEKASAKKGQRGTGSGVVGTADAKDPLAKLREEGIL